MSKLDMSESENALAFYRELVRTLIVENSEQTIENDSASHAKIIISEFIAAAHKEVYIFCRKLSSDIWEAPNVMRCISEALSRGVIFNVMVQDSNPECSRLKSVFSEYKTKILYSKDYESLTCNFLVSDDKAYRYEKNNGERKGIACANDSSIATLLITLAKNIKCVGIPI